MSRFILHTKTKWKKRFQYLAAGSACVFLAVAVGYGIHSIGTAGAKSREVVAIQSGEDVERYLLDRESEDYNLRGRYRLEEDIELDWLYESIGTQVEPFTGTFDGNGHVISGLTRPLFGMMERAEVKNLFLGEAEISHPFTYHDGERYVDGYGALAAYAVDSVIRNCGMGGDLYLSSPSEAEYQIAKASPSDADIWKGPGAQEPAEMKETDRNMEEAGPGVSHEEGGEQEPSISVPSDGNSTEAGQPEITGPETEQTEGSMSETETGPPESELPGTEAEDGRDISKTEPENIEAETSGIENGTAETVEPEQESTQVGTSEGDKKESEGNKEESGAEIEESEAESKTKQESETKPETRLESETKPEEGNNGTKVQVQDTPGTSETVGYQKHDRQYLTLKVSAVMDSSVETSHLASPSDAEIPDATPSNAEETSNAGNYGKENAENDAGKEAAEYIGNPDGDIYILVTAERVTAGGLAAETAGETQISDSFVLVTINSELGEIESYTGGFAGILGNETRTENSYAAGLADSDGVTGGFTAVNHGIIENCYSAMTVGEKGTIKGVFTALGDGRLSGCIYDRQMVCIQDDIEDDIQNNIQDDRVQEEEQIIKTLSTGQATPSDGEGAEFSLKGLNTLEMTGLGTQIPGNWYLAEHAYPQIEYFAQSGQETAASYSRASVIALQLPAGTTLMEVLEGSGIALPEEIDGMEVQWDAEGDVVINAENQVEIGVNATISYHETPTVGTSLTLDSPETVAEPESTESSSEHQTSSPVKLKGTIGNATRNFSLTALMSEAEVQAGPYADWGEVGAAVDTDPDMIDKQPALIDDCYQIGTPEALAWFAFKVNDGTLKNVKAKLTDNIDLFGTTYTKIVYDESANNIEEALQWVPIGNVGYGGMQTFTGEFDGGGFVIRHIYIENERVNQALIGKAGASTTVKNLGMESGKITASTRASGIIGLVENVSNVKISMCWSGVNLVIPEKYTGGFAGSMVGETINANNVLIEGCYNIGTVHTTNGNRVGGITGPLYKGTSVVVKNCFNRGQIISNSSGGGLVGSQQEGGSAHQVLNCYNAAPAAQAVSSQLYNLGNVKNVYYDDQYEYPGGTTGGTPLKTAQLKSWGMAYLLNGQSLTSTNSSNGISWAYDPEINDGFPYPVVGSLDKPADWSAIGQGILDGLITSEKLAADSTTGFYNINTAEKLATFAAMVNNGTPGASATLKADINLTGEKYGGDALSPIPWRPIGKDASTPYTGTFGSDSGHFYRISNLKTDAVGDMGLFGILDGSASVADIGIVDSSITGDTAGAIAAQVAGNAVISRCYNRGNVSARGGADSYVGGIAGKVAGGGTIKDCYNMDSTITGSAAGHASYTGGIAGGVTEASAIVRNCYHANRTGGASGSVTSSGTAGSIVGMTAGTVQSCYSDSSLAADAGAGVFLLKDSSNDELQKMTDTLNTVNGTERMKADRVWYTTLASEDTHGLPGWTAPVTVEVTLDPSIADAGNNVWGIAVVSGVPSGTLLRGIHQENSSSAEFSPTAVNTVKSNFSTYGTINAGKNLALSAGTGNQDISGVTGISLTNPSTAVTDFSKLTLYNAAAYMDTAGRTILVDVSSGTTRYEIRAVIKPITSKTVSLVFSLNPTIDLAPGMNRRSESDDVSVSNENPYPVVGRISGVTPMESKDTKLAPIASTLSGIDEHKDLEKAGIILGMTGAEGSLETVIGSREYYYNPDSGGTWITYEMGSKDKFHFRYFMKYSPLYAGEEKTFGYDIIYSTSISTDDIAPGTVTVEGESGGSSG